MNTKRLLSLLAFLLTICMLFSLLSSCAYFYAIQPSDESTDPDGSEGDADRDGDGDVGGDTICGGVAGPQSTNLYGYELHPLQDLDYRGEVFNILVPQSTEHIRSRDFATSYSEKGSDVIRDAAYNRVLEVNKLYNTDIRATVTSGSVYAEALADFEGRLCNYDLILCEMNRIAALALQGYLADLNEFDGEEIQLDAPWYNQNYVDHMSIGGRLYGVVGDFSLMDNDGIMAIQFNADLWDRLDIENPYTLVYDGTWTVDKMHELCKGRFMDSDGSENFGQHDSFGFIADYHAVNNLMIGDWCHAVKKDADDKPVFSLDSSRALAALDKVLALFNDQTASADLSKIASDRDFSDVYAYSNAIFSEGNTLMRLVPMYAAEQSASIGFDYGYLPMPKFDAAQEQYYHVYSTYSPAVCVPVYLKEGRTTWGNAAVMEALSYYGRTILLYQYYHVLLNGRAARDQDTRKMLDIIFDASYTDFAAAHNFGNVNGIYNDSAVSGENSFMRDYHAAKRAIEAEMSKFTDGWSHILPKI